MKFSHQWQRSLALCCVFVFTLQMSLGGLMSTINLATAEEGNLPIETGLTEEGCTDLSLPTDPDCLALCGDGVKNGFEECDGTDGVGAHQECSATCLLINLPYCGDGIVDPGEECDDGDTKHYNYCTNECKINVCGDGLHQTGVEECDDGNLIDGDGCSASCLLEIPEPFCGDGNVDPGEQCDDGNNVDGDGCSAECLLENPVCGDGIKNGTEECDDGNTRNNDGCKNDCTINICGDYSVWVGIEQCDDGNLTNGDGCSATCQIEQTPVCLQPGEVIISEIMQDPKAVTDANGEWFEVYNPKVTAVNLKGCTISDAGSETHLISSNLIVPAGGYAVLGRQGDFATNGGYIPNYIYNGFTLGNTDDEIIITCCDQIIDRVDYTGTKPWPDPTGASMILNNPDLDNNDGTNWCESSITTFDAGDFGTPGTMNDTCCFPEKPYCGDGIVNQPSEQCDDGNADNTDGCLNTCQLPYCGDGFIWQDHELCDDNGNNGQLCIPPYDSECSYCSEICAPMTLIGPYCGDGIKNGPEQCDGTDGISAGQTCLANCTLENQPYCGNGVVDPGEECDDGNTNNNDQCKNDCTLTECEFDLDVMFVMDRSGSMGYDTPTRLSQAKTAANNFISYLNSTDQSGLVSFATTATLDKQLSNQHTVTQTAINGLTALGATNIGDALDLANQELTSPRHNSEAVPIIILLTDGMANKPYGPGYGEYPADVVYALSKADDSATAGVKIFSIGLGSDVNTAMLEEMANKTGGEYYFAPTAADLEDIFSQIAFDVCQYGTISGCKYSDLNNNGQIDPGEPTLSGWEIILENGGLTTQYTDDSGCFKFIGLPLKNYTLSEGGKIGTIYQQTYPLGNIYNINLVNPDDLVGYHFANYLPFCGNNILDTGIPGYTDEECDLGASNGAPGSTCNQDCTSYLPICGDGIINQPGEQCDDGNTDNTDGCLNTCQLPTCGDGFIWTGHELCDDNGLNGQVCTPAYGGECTYCSAVCEPVTLYGPYCGDGIKNGLEQCDGTAGVPDHYTCNAQCTLDYLPYCGDGVVNQTSEQCDDGNDIDTDDCKNNCTLPSLCEDDVDIMLVIDRSGSMGYASRCDWWQLTCVNKPFCTSYVWQQKTDYNVSQTWCSAKNQSAPHESVWTAYDPVKITASKQTANNFLSLMGSGDQSGLVSFANTATLDKALSNNHPATQSAVNALITVGATNIGDAIKLATTELTSIRKNPTADQIMILLTDGMANKPYGPGYGEYPADVTYALSKASEAAAAGIKIFTIGLDSEINATMLQQIASLTGGEYYFSPTSNELDDIFNALKLGVCEEENQDYCGNGIKNGPEECDGTDGVGPNQECSATCTLINLPYCGDGIKNGPEECDGTDGVGPGQSCSALCLLENTLCYQNMDVLMVMDRSGSMGYDNPTRLSEAKSAANGFLSKLGAGDQSGLVSFATTASLNKTLSNSHTATQSQINSLVAVGATNIGDSIKMANAELSSSRINPLAEQIMILLTDGKANKPNGPGYGEYASDVAYALAKADEAASAGIKIFTIGLGSDINATMLQQIATKTGGTYYFAPTANDLDEIFDQITTGICQKIGQLKNWFHSLGYNYLLKAKPEYFV